MERHFWRHLDCVVSALGAWGPGWGRSEARLVQAGARALRARDGPVLRAAPRRGLGLARGGLGGGAFESGRLARARVLLAISPPWKATLEAGHPDPAKATPETRGSVCLIGPRRLTNSRVRCSSVSVRPRSNAQRQAGTKPLAAAGKTVSSSVTCGPWTCLLWSSRKVLRFGDVGREPVCRCC